jgi:putative CocE/NonD family hydrolase
VYEVVEWVAGQSWSDGNVGMQGGSYDAITQLLGAAKQPPHLKAIVPTEAFADAYRDVKWHNGIWDADFLTQWTLLQAGLSASGTAFDPRFVDRIYNFLAVQTLQAPWNGALYWERSV